jgi:hypothetical protein
MKSIAVHQDTPKNLASSHEVDYLYEIDYEKLYKPYGQFFISY